MSIRKLNQSRLASKKLVNGVGRTRSTVLVVGSGTNGSTSIVDTSDYAHTVSVLGNTQISTATFPTGMSSSILFDGTGDTLSIADNDLFSFGTANFTIELYVRFLSLFGDKGFISHFTAPPSIGFNLRYTQNVSPNGIRFVTGNGASVAVLQSSWAPLTNVWYHVAVVRDGNLLRCYINGAQIGSNSITIDVPSPSAPLVIGTSQTVANSDFHGYLSNIRVTPGLCLYPGGTSFTPPTLPLNGIFFT